MTAIFSIDNDFSFFDNSVPESLRQHAMDALVLEVQDLVQTFFKGYEVHGREHLYHGYFCHVRDRISTQIRKIRANSVNTETYHDKIINKKINEYKSKMDAATKELSQSEIYTNPAI